MDQEIKLSSDSLSEARSEAIDVLLNDSESGYNNEQKRNDEVIEVSDSESEDLLEWLDELVSDDNEDEISPQPAQDLYCLALQFLREAANKSLDLNIICSQFSDSSIFYRQIPTFVLKNRFLEEVFERKDQSGDVIHINKDNICSIGKRIKESGFTDENIHEAIVKVLRSSGEVDSWTSLSIAKAIQFSHSDYQSLDNTASLVTAALQSRKGTVFKLIPNSYPESWSLMTNEESEIPVAETRILRIPLIEEPEKKLKVSAVQSIGNVDFDTTLNQKKELCSSNHLEILTQRDCEEVGEKDSKLASPLQNSLKEEESLVKTIENCMMSSIDVKSWTSQTLYNEIQAKYSFKYNNDLRLGIANALCNYRGNVIQQDPVSYPKRYRLKPKLRKSLMEENNMYEEYKQPLYETIRQYMAENSKNKKSWRVSELVLSLGDIFKNNPAASISNALNSRKDILFLRIPGTFPMEWCLKEDFLYNKNIDFTTVEMKRFFSDIKHILESTIKINYWTVADIAVDLLTVFPHYRACSDVSLLVTESLLSKENTVIEKVLESNAEFWRLKTRGEKKIQDCSQPLHEVIANGMESHHISVWTTSAIVRHLLHEYPFEHSNSKIESVVSETLLSNQGTLFHQISGTNPTLWYLNIKIKDSSNFNGLENTSFSNTMNSFNTQSLMIQDNQSSNSVSNQVTYKSSENLLEIEDVKCSNSIKILNSKRFKSKKVTANGSKLFKRKMSMVSMLATVLKGKRLTRKEITRALKSKYHNFRFDKDFGEKVSSNLSRLDCFKKIKYNPGVTGRKCNKWTLSEDS